MIVQLLLKLVYNFLSLLLVFDLPSMPDDVYTYISDALSYVSSGIDLLSGFIGSSAVIYLGALLSIVVLIESAWLVYRFIMWVLRKIPILGIE